MLILEHEQGTDEWFAARLGKATASCFKEVMTTKQLKRAKNDYIYLLAAEAVSGEEQKIQFSNVHTERGHENEPEAISWYEFETGLDVEQVGFCIPHKGAQYGISPDGLIGEDGGLEIKAPELKTHIKYMVNAELPDEYKGQVYGSLCVSGRDWWDFMSYHKQSQPFVIRVTKEDPEYIKWAAAFEKVLPEFLTDLNKIIELAKLQEQ